ncbi:MAG: hypothetical protein RLZZ15_327 [Verrucomicrobiota bacterium]|jgi:hypothetical protein
MAARPKQLVFVGIAGLVLLAGIGLQGIRLRNVKEGDRSGAARPINLAARLPSASAGWEAKDELLGATEVASSAVERTLNCDDFCFRVFRRGGTQLSVYVAYWGAGRMPLQKVASHTPDRCWTENGWRCDEMRFGEKVAAGSSELRTAQWRRFTPPDGSAPQFVLFWHLVGDRLYDYGERFNARPDLLKWWRDTLGYAMSGSEAQYFIRVSSNRPFSEFAAEPLWGEVVASLGKLGLKTPIPLADGAAR